MDETCECFQGWGCLDCSIFVAETDKEGMYAIRCPEHSGVDLKSPISDIILVELLVVALCLLLEHLV